MPEPAPIDLWLTMGSTYTYLTLMRLGPIEASTGIRFRLRPFNLRAIFDEAAYFPFPAGSPKTRYMWRDIERRAAAYGIPIRVPALEEGWGREFALAAYRQWFQFGEETGMIRAGPTPGRVGTLRRWRCWSACGFAPEAVCDNLRAV